MTHVQLYVSCLSEKQSLFPYLYLRFCSCCKYFSVSSLLISSLIYVFVYLLYISVTYYRQSFLHKRCHFPPFFASADILLLVEVESMLKRLAGRIANKWKQPYFRTCGYVKSRIAITMVCMNHHYVQGPQVPECNSSVHWSQWEDGAGLHLYGQCWRGNKKALITSVIYFMSQSQNCVVFQSQL